MNAEPPRRRKSTNLSLDEKLVAEAKELGVNLSRASEAGLTAEVREARRQRWVEENRTTIEAWNRWVSENGLPLAKYRQF